MCEPPANKTPRNLGDLYLCEITLKAMLLLG